MPAQLILPLASRWRRWSGGPQSPLARRRQWSVADGLGSPADKAVGDDYKEAQRKKQRTVFTFVRRAAGGVVCRDGMLTQICAADGLRTVSRSSCWWPRTLPAAVCPACSPAGGATVHKQSPCAP